ncbi:MBL fold metallo-hydrolase [Paenibacillus xerothermodurans]|uniref:MBL fold metallo-hydrolase n=1 Tax=Paenibacillus xerothermodurans TaxID=1977292 RepID=A0A2W1N6E3_PAEXE|nr:MBL fold metallo-hydrolase [Paenibacillus xerothermodurans]PZE19937.1 MBL fold metallo-hydrolase [Paenibacillus xerothermodurans]
MNPLHILHNDDIYQIKVPLPFPLRWVNSYLIRGSDGWTIVDPGLHTDAAVQLWERVLGELRIGFQDIEQIVLTHHHPDHYGLAGLFQRRSQAPVLMSKIGYEQTRLLWADDQPMTETLLQLFRSHGLPSDQLERMKDHMDEFVPMVTPEPDVSFIALGESLPLGDHHYETLHTPGHASGHVCFYRRDTKDMLCGDHVIPQISPNVSYLPGIDENPLASFLCSLDEISRYEVDMAYPGHREPFADFGKRASDLIRHHETRLQTMRSMVSAEPLTGYEVCLQAFGDRLTLHQLRFALSETLAHLIFLREAALVEQIDHAGLTRYRSIG